MTAQSEQASLKYPHIVASAVFLRHILSRVKLVLNGSVKQTHDGLVYKGKLVFDGKPVLMVEDDGMGGETSFYPVAGQSYAEMKAAVDQMYSDMNIMEWVKQSDWAETIEDNETEEQRDHYKMEFLTYCLASYTLVIKQNARSKSTLFSTFEQKLDVERTYKFKVNLDTMDTARLTKAYNDVMAKVKERGEFMVMPSSYFEQRGVKTQPDLHIE